MISRTIIPPSLHKCITPSLHSAYMQTAVDSTKRSSHGSKRLKNSRTLIPPSLNQCIHASLPHLGGQTHLQWQVFIQSEKQRRVQKQMTCPTWYLISNTFILLSLEYSLLIWLKISPLLNWNLNLSYTVKKSVRLLDCHWITQSLMTVKARSPAECFIPSPDDASFYPGDRNGSSTRCRIFSRHLFG